MVCLFGTAQKPSPPLGSDELSRRTRSGEIPSREQTAQVPARDSEQFGSSFHLALIVLDLLARLERSDERLWSVHPMHRWPQCTGGWLKASFELRQP